MIVSYLVFLVFVQLAGCYGPPIHRFPCGSELTSHRNWRLLDKTDICGVGGSSAGPRILGGRKAKEGEFPWMAMLVKVNDYGQLEFECGGAIINSRYILTAAHCLTPKVRYVQVGGMNRYIFSKCSGVNCHAKIFAIERKIPHEHYNFHNDIALIRLQEEIQFDDHKLPICLPASCNLVNKNFKDTELLVAGWGLSDQDGTIVNDGPLRTVDILSTSLDVCGERWAHDKKIILRSQICSWGSKPGGGVRGSERGDSGGPIVFRDLRAPGLTRHYAVGLVSYGPGANLENLKDQTWKESYKFFPMVDTRVAAYMPWILENIEQ